MDNWIPDHEEDVGQQTEGRPHPHAVELHQDGHQQEPGGVPLKWELFGENWISCTHFSTRLLTQKLRPLK